MGAPELRFVDGFGQRWAQHVKEPLTGYSLNLGGGDFRFEVRQGEHPALDDVRDGTPNANERAEMYLADTDYSVLSLPQATSLWLSGSLTVERENTASSCIVLQFHATEDASDASASPVAALMLDSAGRLVVESRTSAENPLTSNPAGVSRYVGASAFPVGRRTAFVVNAKFDYAGAGFLKVWMDGLQIVDFAGAIGFNDAEGPYLKVGIYRPTSAAPMVVRWKNLECGTADLSARILSPLP